MLFPKEELLEFIQLPDDIVGIPHGWHGTMDPIGTLRLYAKNFWVDIALRHWSLSKTFLYNSSEEADKELK